MNTPIDKHTPTQPLAIKAQLHNTALCVDCGLFFNWLHQTKHDGCPECNSKTWIGSEKIRTAVNSHEALLEFAKKHHEVCEDCQGSGKVYNNADPTSGQWVECPYKTAIVWAEVRQP